MAPLSFTFFWSGRRSITGCGDFLSNSVLFAGIDRKWVRSVGAAARVNLMGFAVAEIDYVRPLDRPGRGWMWQFNLSPGF